MSAGKTRRRVYVLTPVLAPHDAIGNDVLGMARCLRNVGIPVETYAEHVHPALASEARNLKEASSRCWADPDALVIYHHSMAWPAGQNIVSDCRCRVVVKHHNVTPPEFFHGYSPDHVSACEAGERATSDLAGRRDVLFWADSQFNAADLVDRGARAEGSRVLPPFHTTETMGRTAPDLATVNRFRRYTGARLLFVGGTKPNKGHRTLIRVLAYFRRRYDPDAVLLLAGGSDPRLSAYQDSLIAHARELHVEDAVIFTGSVSAATLRSLYLLADVFVCVSDHEGFCVPLIEAMYFRTPIVASAWTAVTETVANAGLTSVHNDIEDITANIDRCVTVSGLSSGLMCAGWRRFHNVFSTSVIEKRFLQLVEEAFAA